MLQLQPDAFPRAASPPPRPRLQTPGSSDRSLISRLAASALITAALALPARAYDLQDRQNGTRFSGAELQQIFNAGLPTAYERAFPEQRWITYLLLDAHADQGLVAITLGLSPRVGPSQALLPVATFSVIEPLPRQPSQWRELLERVANQYGRLMLSNQGRIGEAR